MRAVYWNGKITPWDTVRIPFDDPAFQYGEGVFTTLRVHNGSPRFLKAHLERFKEQSSLLNFPTPLIDERALGDLIMLNGCSRGDFRLKLIRSARQELAFLTPYTSFEGQVCTLRIEDLPYFTPTASLKTLAYLDRKRAREQAQAAGYADSILTCPNKMWLETGSGNLFWHEEGRFFYPGQTAYYLKGVVLSHLIEQKGMQPAAKNPGPEAHLYFCNSLHGVRPVVKVEGIAYPRHLGLEKEWALLVK